MKNEAELVRDNYGLETVFQKVEELSIAHDTMKDLRAMLSSKIANIENILEITINDINN